MKWPQAISYQDGGRRGGAGRINNKDAKEQRGATKNPTCAGPMNSDMQTERRLDVE